MMCFFLTGTVLTASFRGRPLEGCKQPLPEGYVGKLSFLTKLGKEYELSNIIVCGVCYLQYLCYVYHRYCDTCYSCTLVGWLVSHADTVCCGKWAGWINLLLCSGVGLSQCHIVLDGDQKPPQIRELRPKRNGTMHHLVTACTLNGGAYSLPTAYDRLLVTCSTSRDHKPDEARRWRAKCRN